MAFPIEVRDSPEWVILVPGCDGPGFLPDLDGCWDIAAAVAVAAVTSKFRSTFRPGNSLGVFNLDYDSHERYMDFNTRVLHRLCESHLSSRVVWPGSHFRKITVYEEQYLL